MSNKLGGKLHMEPKFETIDTTFLLFFFLQLLFSVIKEYFE